MSDDFDEADRTNPYIAWGASRTSRIAARPRA